METQRTWLSLTEHIDFLERVCAELLRKASSLEELALSGLRKEITDYQVNALRLLQSRYQTTIQNLRDKRSAVDVIASHTSCGADEGAVAPGQYPLVSSIVGGARDDAGAACLLVSLMLAEGLLTDEVLDCMCVCVPFGKRSALRDALKPYVKQ